LDIFKINFYAAIRKEVGACLGFIMCDSEGLEPREAEAFAFNGQLSRQQSCYCLMLVMKQVVCRWYKSGTRKRVFHGIVEDSRRFLVNSHRKNLLFTKRSRNQEVHCLASLVFTFHDVCWIEEVPFQLDQIIANNVSYLNFHHQ